MSGPFRVVYLVQETYAGTATFDDAFALFYNYLDPLYSRLGAYDTCVRLLKQLFNESRNAQHLTNTSDRVWALNVLGASYNFGGRPAAAIEAWKSIYRQAESSRDKALALINSGIGQLSMGQLLNAERSFSQALSIAKDADEPHWEGVAQRELGVALAAQGKWKLALDMVPLPETQDSEAPMIYGTRARIFMMSGDRSGALSNAREAEQIAAEFPLVWNQLFSLRCLSAEITYFNEDDTRRRRPDVAGLLAEARKAHWLEREASLLLVEANNRLRDQELSGAKDLIEESIFLSGRSGFRLRQIDTLILLGRIEKRAGNATEAQRLGELALELSTALDGSTYEPGIQRGRRLLS